MKTNGENEYRVELQAADGRTRWRVVTGRTETIACGRALRFISREVPVDSKGKASGWRVVRVG